MLQVTIFLPLAFVSPGKSDEFRVKINCQEDRVPEYKTVSQQPINER